MSSIDERVVEAKFDNKQFQSGVKDTLGSLDSLKKGLQLDGATQGLDGIANATGRISRGFSVMRIAAATAIATIAHQATIAGEHLLKSFTIGPLLDGFHEYETQLNSVQTILANTQWQHASMKDVNSALYKLNVYSDKTIYNFSEMARNIGTFTAAGVKLDVSVNAIKGIANLAAISGSNAQQASTAMYQLSQALSSGTVKLMDWNSVVNAGMGGKVFQDALMDTARVHGIAIDKMVKKEGSFRNTLQRGWLTSKILTETLSKFTGEESRAQLKRQGYTEKQINDIIKMGKTATDAATKVKTFTQLMGTLKEAAGSGWTQTWQEIIGNFGQAKTLWTGVYKVLGNAITQSGRARNRVLKDWAALGGRKELIGAISDAFHELLDILKPIRDAFREIFPPKTGQDLYNLTVGFRNLVDRFKIGADTANNLKRTMAGVFAVLDIGWQVIKQVAHFLGDLLGMIGHGSGGILNFTGNIGDMLVSLDKAIKTGHGLQDFFKRLEHGIAPVVEFLKLFVTGLAHVGVLAAGVIAKILSFLPHIAHVFGEVVSKIQGFFSGMFQGFDFGKVLQIINAGLFAGILLLVRKFIKHFTDKGPSPLQGFIDKITEPFEQLTATLKQMQKTLQAATILEIAIAVGVLTASVVSLSKINTKDLGKALGAISVMFGQLIGGLYLFNKVGGAKGLFITSAGLILFATALRVLTSSVKALAQLSWQELAKGLVGVTALIGALVAATKGMQGNAGGMIRAGAGLILLAAAIKILASAVQDLSGLSWGEMAKGLTGVAATLLALGLFTKFADANKGAGLNEGASLLMLAAAIKILASAVQDFSKISWEGLGKGFVAISGILVAVTVFSKTVGNPVKLMAASASLIAIGVAMNILALAMKSFGNLSWGEIAKGLVSMGAALILISAALNSMPITSALSAAALVGVSVALTAIAAAMKLLGGQSWNEVAKGLVTLAGALAIIAIAMDAMTFALPGAAALLVVAASLAILVPELALLGALSWTAILKGLVALAGAFTVIGIAGALLTPTIPTLFGLAASIALLGVGVAAIGAGVYLFATGLTVLSVSGAAAASAIKLIFDSLISLLPDLAIALGKTLVALAKAIAAAAPQLMLTAVILFDQILTAINMEAPKIIKTFFRLLQDLLNALDSHSPKIIRVLYNLLMDILHAIEDKSPGIVAAFTRIVVNVLEAMAQGSPKIVRAAVDWVVSIINAISDNLGRIVTAGTNLVIHFIQGVGSNSVRLANAALDVVVEVINGIANAITTHQDELNTAGRNLAIAVADGMTLGMASKAADVGNAAVNLVKSGWNAATSWLHSHSPSRRYMQLGRWVAQGFAIGIVGGKQQVIDAWNQMRDALKQSISDTKSDIQNYQQQLKDAEKAHDHKKIDRYTAALAEARKEYTASVNALDLMTHHMDKQHDHLIRLGKRYDELTAKIDKAKQALTNAKQIRDDYRKSTTSQYEQLPDISADTQLSDYEKTLKKQVVDTQSFADVMAELRKMGLDDAQYLELISKGPDVLPFAEQVLAGGKDAVEELNSLDSQLQLEAKALAKSASTALYQAGVNSAQGLLDGLQKRRADIADAMRHIAHILVREIKDELKIHSPSEVFDELGQFTGKGLALGLKKSVPHVQKATQQLGKNTVESMKQSIREMNDMLAVETDLNPTITPVLDLSTVRKQAIGVGHVLGQRIGVDGVYAKAVNASAGYQANIDALAPGDISETVAPNVTFIQNNNSPKALSTAEIYRNTNNQLSRAKGALNPSAA